MPKRYNKKMKKSLVLVGNRGALGSAIEKYFVSNEWNCIGVSKSPVVSVTESNPIFQIYENQDYKKIDAVICVAGGYLPTMLGNPSSQCLETLWKSNVVSSLHATSFAKHNNVPILILTGSQSVFSGGTPYAMEYGACKSAVHHLASSFKLENNNKRVHCILPRVLDTLANRNASPHANFSEWTPLDEVAQVVWNLCKVSDSRVFIPI
jgi:dihydropteridine reductase